MGELEEIKELTPKFQLKLLTYVSSIETFVTEVLSIDMCKTPKDIVKRVKFYNHFEPLILGQKINLLKIVFEDHYPTILKKYPNYFVELGEIKSMRDSIAHNTIAYEQNSKTKTNTKLILNNPKIKKQKRLTKRKMESMMVKTDKVFNETHSIFKEIGKLNGIRF